MGTHPQFNDKEFLTFLLVHAANADLNLSEDEINYIKSTCGAENFNKVSLIYQSMTDYERIQEILSYKGIYYPTADRKAELLNDIQRLFASDGEYSHLEYNLNLFLKKLL